MIKQLLNISQNNPLKSYQSTADWAKDYYKLTKDKTPIDKAILGGFSCQQFSFAFMAGYQTALEIMFPLIAPNEIKALCVSETKGVHPKSIQTTLINNRINGLKTYVTAGSEVAHLLVLCKTDQTLNNRPVLKMVHLPRTAKNINITDFELPFMKEVKHGKLQLNNTEITTNQILEGDGYDQYTKPFRTLEDICVSASYQAMLLRQAIDNQWADDLRDQIILSIYTLKKLLELSFSDQETILLVAAHQQNFDRLLPEIELHIADHATSHFKADWEINKRFLSMGQKLRRHRVAKARNSIF